MNSIHVQLDNCYGIKFLDERFDFSEERAYAIYAPNGVMKSTIFQRAKRRRIASSRTVCREAKFRMKWVSSLLPKASLL